MNNEERRAAADRRNLRSIIHVRWEGDYDDSCSLVEPEDEGLVLWEQLGDKLGGRSNWWFAVAFDRSERLPVPEWRFGAGRSGLLIVTIDEDRRIAVFDHSADETLAFEDLERFMRWLERREKSLAGFTGLQQAILDDPQLHKGYRHPIDEDNLSGQWVLPHGAREAHFLVLHEPRQIPLFDSGVTVCNRDGGPPYMRIRKEDRQLPRCFECQRLGGAAASG